MSLARDGFPYVLALIAVAGRRVPGLGWPAMSRGNRRASSGTPPWRRARSRCRGCSSRCWMQASPGPSLVGVSSRHRRSRLTSVGARVRRVRPSAGISRQLPVREGVRDRARKRNRAADCSCRRDRVLHLRVLAGGRGHYAARAWWTIDRGDSHDGGAGGVCDPAVRADGADHRTVVTCSTVGDDDPALRLHRSGGDQHPGQCRGYLGRRTRLAAGPQRRVVDGSEPHRSAGFIRSLSASALRRELEIRAGRADFRLAPARRAKRRRGT